jgi:hypothetical protein
LVSENACEPPTKAAVESPAPAIFISARREKSAISSSLNNLTTL